MATNMDGLKGNGEILWRRGLSVAGWYFPGHMWYVLEHYLLWERPLEETAHTWEVNVSSLLQCRNQTTQHPTTGVMYRLGCDHLLTSKM